MKKLTPLIVCLTIAALSLGSTLKIRAQDADQKDKSAEASASVDPDKSDKGDKAQQISKDNQGSSGKLSSTAHKVSPEQVDKHVTTINKASSLVGMQVKNLQNENLGKVEDLVIDFNSGKVGYAVVSVGGFLGINEKYVAVPLAAFAAPRGEKHLVLNASKEKLQSVQGFTKNEYPDLDTPMWGSEAGFGESASKEDQRSKSGSATGSSGSKSSESRSSSSGKSSSSTSDSSDRKSDDSK